MKYPHKPWLFICLFLLALACATARWACAADDALVVGAAAAPVSGRTVCYQFATGTPRKVKQATIVAAKAWTDQTGIRFVYEPRQNMADVVIVWMKQYGFEGHGMVYNFDYPWIGGPPGTLACAWIGRPTYVYINANTKDKINGCWRWARGDFGRWGKTCALDGMLMHELGHCLLLKDVACNPASMADPLGDRENWPTLYGRIWEQKLILKKTDYDELRRAEAEGLPAGSTVYFEEALKP